MYDSRADLVTRLTAIRAAIDKVRDAQSYSTGIDMSVTRERLRNLLKEERDVLKKINQIDAESTGGMANRVQFNRVT